MVIGHRDEKAINASLGRALGKLHPRSTVLVERTGMLENGGKQPDLIVEMPGRERIVVENKYAEKSTTLERDCKRGLEDKWESGELVRVVLGLKTPDRFDTCADAALDEEISTAQDFQWAAWKGDKKGRQRYPEAGWISGSLANFSAFVDRAGMEYMDTDDLVDSIQACVRLAAEQVGEMDEKMLGGILYQPAGYQTNLMAMVVIFNAIVFQGHVARHHEIIRNPGQMIDDDDVTQVDVLEEWKRILDINYYPIFGIAKELLRSFSDQRMISRVLAGLYRTAARVFAKSFDAQGMVGKLFGQLISDRKLLATYYTLPSSASLLSELAVSRLDVDWSESSAISELRIGDLACGTGALLVSVYRRMAERYRAYGKDDAKLHSRMIESVLLGCDIVPTAVHLTAAILAGEHPDVDYTSARTWLMPYGRMKEHGKEAIRVGSLELLVSDFTPTLFGDGSRAVSSTEEKGIRQAQVGMSSMDLIIMNPPYTRSVGQEAEKRGIPNPAFAGMGNDERDQKDMSDVLKKFYKQFKKARVPSANSAHAGLGSNFFDLANLKLKPGGVLALILPATAVSGSAWKKFRECLHLLYSNIMVVSLAGTKPRDQSFSDSTNMAEVMFVATKREEPVSADHEHEATFATLGSRPENSVEAIECVRSLSRKTNGIIKVGDQPVGWVSRAPFPISGAGTPEGIANTDVAYSAASLTNGQGLVLPQMKEWKIPLSRLSTQGTRGPYHMKIDADYQGCFTVERLPDRKRCRSVSWPILWRHKKDFERAMIVDPCSEGKLLDPKYRDDALDLWSGNNEVSGATFLHINRDFGVNAQSLGACMTSVKAIGGRAWPSFASFYGKKGEKAICLWLNTTLGLIGRWWISTRQQSGRAILSVTTIGNIPALDCGALSKKQFDQVKSLFLDFKDRPLLPANECYRDEARQDLDARFLCGILGMPESTLESLEILRLQWCREPSVHGGKKTRPDEAVALR